jgi:hypothetical protein
MKLNTIIEMADGRIGTVCYHNLDGVGGVWGEHIFEMPEGGFGDLPQPEFMLREKRVEETLRKYGHRPDVECVGEFSFRRKDEKQI